MIDQMSAGLAGAGFPGHQHMVAEQRQPVHRAVLTKPDRQRVQPDREPPADAAAITCCSGSLIKNQASSSCGRPGTERTRQSSAPKVWHSRSETLPQSSTTCPASIRARTRSRSRVERDSAAAPARIGCRCCGSGSAPRNPSWPATCTGRSTTAATVTAAAAESSARRTPASGTGWRPAPRPAPGSRPPPTAGCASWQTAHVSVSDGQRDHGHRGAGDDQQQPSPPVSAATTKSSSSRGSRKGSFRTRRVSAGTRRPTNEVVMALCRLGLGPATRSDQAGAPQQ